MARRRITAVLEQQHNLRELGRIRFGERKPTEGRPRPGRPVDFPRVSSQRQEIVEQVAQHYGGQVQRWERDTGGVEWDVQTTGPIAVCCPPKLEVATTAYEQWAGGFNTVRCDGAECEFRNGRGQWVTRACRCAELGIEPEDRDCKKTTRILVMVVGVEGLGRFRVETKSHYASEELPAALAFLRESGRAAWMRMERRERRVMAWDEKAGEDKPLVKKFPVIVVDAPFFPDEVMHLERAADMAALPAPRVSAPALPRGARPEIGPGIVEPRGPKVGDRLPPPREPAPVDLTASTAEEPSVEEPPANGEDTRAAELEQALAGRAGGVQGALPGTEQTGASADPDRAA